MSNSLTIRLYVQLVNTYSSVTPDRMPCRGFRIYYIGGELSRNVPRTRPERASEYVADCQESTFFLLSALDVGDDAVNVKLDNGGFAFVAEEELQRFPAVHKS